MLRRTLPVLIAFTALACSPASRTWERQQDCADRADRVIESMRRQLDGSSTVLGNWQLHYSAKAERCYMLLEEYHQIPVGLGINAPYRQERLWDVLKRREIARFTRDGGDSDVWKDWCQLIRPDASRAATPSTCQEITALADDLMNN